MPKWTRKAPDRFLASWHSILLQGIGKRFLAGDMTLIQARKFCDRFRHFRWCLREFPNTPAGAIERDFIVKCITDPNEQGTYDVFIEIKEHLDLSSVKKVLGV